MAIIASLKVTNADRPRQLPVIVQRRNKLINALHDQLELAWPKPKPKGGSIERHAAGM